MSVTRRQFLRTSGTAASLAFAGQPLLTELLAYTTPKLRRNFRNLDATHATVVGYKRAITLMQALSAIDPDDPRGWLYQANMHGVPDGTPGPMKPAWNSCTHGNFFFLSWHRMYLYFFERIVRNFSGDPEWALPFWDYSDPTQRALPAVFRLPNTEQNPLYVEQRDPCVNGGQELDPASVSITLALQQTAFTGNGTRNFGGQRQEVPGHLDRGFGRLESTPHNSVHDAIGGASGWMGDVLMAARDPIFWVHHCNIDRLWGQWLAQGGGRVSPVGDSWWTTPRFLFFDEKKQEHRMSACDILDAAAQLGYTYEGQSAPAESCPKGPLLATAAMPERPLKLLVSAPQPIRLGASTTSVTLDVGAAPTVKSIARSTQRRLVVTLEGIEAPMRPGGHYAVFVHLPLGTVDLDPNGPYFVGNVTFFGARGHGNHDAGHAQERSYDVAFDVPPQVEAELEKSGEDASRLTVTLVPVGAIGHRGMNAAVTVRRIAIASE